MYSGDLSDLSVEPSTIRRLTVEQKDRLTDILDQYLAALEDGVPPQTEDLLRQHPDLVEPLQAYLASLETLHDVAAGFGNHSDQPEAEAAPLEGDEKRLGDFALVREIGHGGMGVVYEARQISLGRRVALKVLPFAAVLDSKQIARFKNEAQAAAQLHHPNIVPVFAVGADRGVHYYAMQFIDGQPLDRAIAELRSKFRSAEHDSSVADIEPQADEGGQPEENARGSTCHSFLTQKSDNRHQYFRSVVRLGIQAAEALHAAHEYGIVHRDIKPSNLLLDGDGKLWVTDFGLARCQTDAALTKTGDLVGTMRYMSPEQAAGQTALIDQRSDVCSLGTTLYELLALRPAFPGQDGPALLRQIEQHDPARLSRLQPEIPADLETVIFKAMAKRREERYATAEQFAEDLRCVLEGKPTVAKPPTIPDRLNKWARRHKHFVGGVAAACLLAVIGLAVSTFLIAREKARTEQNFVRAETEYRRARSMLDRFGARFAEQLGEVPGAESLRHQWLQETLEYYRDLVEEAGDDPGLQADLALTYTKIGTMAEAIGSTEDAIAAYEKAQSILQRLVADEPHEDEHQSNLALCRNNLALLLSRSGETDDARRAYHEAIRRQQELVSDSPDVAQYRRDLALSHNNLGLLQSQTAEPDKAEESFRNAIRLQQDLVTASPDDPEQARNLAASYNNLSALYADEQPSRAAESYQKAITYQQRAVAACPDAVKYRSDLALTCNNLGAALSRTQQFRDAAVSYGQAIELQQQLVRAAPSHRSYRRDLAVSYNNLGLTQSELRQTADAERSFLRALELQEILVGQYPRNIGLQSSLGGVCNNLGIVLEENQRLEEAAEAYKKAVDHQRVAHSRAAAVARYRIFLSKHYYNYGRVLRNLGRADEAVRVALERKELWPNDPRRLFTVAEELGVASNVLAQTDETAAERCAALAIDTLREAIAAGLDVPSDLHWNEAFTALKDRADFAELVKN